MGKLFLKCEVNKIVIGKTIHVKFSAFFLKWGVIEMLRY